MQAQILFNLCKIYVLNANFCPQKLDILQPFLRKISSQIFQAMFSFEL
jgi:hypothetical protein